MRNSKTTYTGKINIDELENATQHPCLIVLKGSVADLRTLIRLDRNLISIGRGDAMDIQIPEIAVSRNHALLQRLNANQFLLIDTNSSNGTLVNNKPVTTVLLEDQDVIAIGNNLFKFLAQNNPEQAHYQALLEKMHLDHALQIYNKHYFLTKLDEEIVNAYRYNHFLALLIFDADHFKRLNDNYGHLAGDAVLMHIVETVKKRIRKTDLFCRYGGEEFTIIMPHTSEQQAFVVAETIRSLIAKNPVEYENQLISVTISIGVTALNHHYQANNLRDLLISQADSALYQAKQAGRNQVIMFEPKLETQL
ncbi:GGDEF domain-containing protein [Methylocucumis oryzae]|uniref:GGDEF domain-containing protein n=1 Tax=Methylocucumis oryzae TaxID=1632867 RepID=UPI0009E2B903|nr:GGDEF domain-containing protein [Methylocucumis oryzae]